MKANNKVYSSQVTNFLNTNMNPLINVYDLNKNKQIKTTKIIKNNNIFITENSVHFDNNVITKKNSQFLPKIKNYVKNYQIEMNKLYYWPSFTKEETIPVINNSILSSTLSKKNSVVALATATPQSKIEGEKNKITYSKKVKISKLNTNKKGSLINNKIIENLNSNNLTSS